MKTLPPLALLLSLGCSTQPLPRVQFQPHPVPAGLRLPEQLGTYHLGRHVDSAGSLHEAHRLHRVETESRWDLRPTP